MGFHCGKDAVIQPRAHARADLALNVIVVEEARRRDNLDLRANLIHHGQAMVKGHEVRQFAFDEIDRTVVSDKQVSVTVHDHHRCIASSFLAGCLRKVWVGIVTVEVYPPSAIGDR
jgi:hypothetical protein